MTLPTDPGSSWLSGTGSQSRLFGTGSDDYELYEQDGEFVLSIEMPGFERDDIEVGWYEWRLTVAAEHEDDRRDRTRTYRRSFRMPKRIDDDDIRARYQKAILDVYLPSLEGTTPKGKTIPIEELSNNSLVIRGRRPRMAGLYVSHSTSGMPNAPLRVPC